MVTDYSHLADGSMWPTSGLAGGTAANDAMTADGSEPAEPLERTPDAPDVTAEDCDGRHTEDGGTGRPGARWVNVSGRR